MTFVNSNIYNTKSLYYHITKDKYQVQLLSLKELPVFKNLIISLKIKI